MADVQLLIPWTLRFFDKVIYKADFKRHSTSAILFEWIRAQIPICCMRMPGLTILNFATDHARELRDEDEYRQIIRFVWYKAKEIEGGTRHRLMVFFLAVGAISGRLSMTNIKPEGADLWVEAMEDGLAQFLSCPKAFPKAKTSS